MKILVVNNFYEVGDIVVWAGKYNYITQSSQLTDYSVYILNPLSKWGLIRYFQILYLNYKFK